MPRQPWKPSNKALGCFCFPAGTLVATAGGETPIEQLRAGDTVLAEDPTTGKVEAERVTAAIGHPVIALARVALSDGSAVAVTAEIASAP